MKKSKSPKVGRRSLRHNTAKIVLNIEKSQGVWLLVLEVHGNMSNSIVENPKFTSFIEALNPAYPVPGRNTLSNEISQLLVEMKARVQLHLEEAIGRLASSLIYGQKGNDFQLYWHIGSFLLLQG